MRLIWGLILVIASVLAFVSKDSLDIRDAVRYWRASLGFPVENEQWTKRTIALLEQAPPRVKDLLYTRDSTLVRWAVGSELRIWIDAPPRIDGVPGALPARVHRSIALWRAARLPLKVRYVEKAEEANVHVTWIKNLPGETIGITELIMNDMLGVQSARIFIALHDSQGKPLDADKVDATLLHEAGHLLGLVHTDNDRSAMHPRSRVKRPSAEDIEVLQMLYRLPLGPAPTL